MISSNKAKKPHLELLRFLAVYFVVLTHTGKRGYTFFTTLDPSAGYYLSMLIPVVCNVAVPLFYMISGATLLGKDETPAYILRHRIPRYLIVLVLSSALMYGYYGLRNDEPLSAATFIKSVYTRNIIVPYWFLYSYVGFLLLLPFTRTLVQGLNDRQWVYLFGLYFVFNGAIPILQFLLSRGSMTVNASLNVTMITADILIYPALGYYLERRNPGAGELSRLWLCALAAVALTVYMTQYKIVLTGEVDEGRVGTFYKSLRFLPSAAVYATIKMLTEKARRAEGFVCAMGGSAFGVYLIEQIVREEWYPLRDKMCDFLPPLTATLIYVGAVVFVCSAIVWLIKLVPGVKRMI